MQRGRQQVSPERPADVTHLAAGGRRGAARGGGRGAWSAGEGADLAERVVPGASRAVPTPNKRLGAGAAGLALRLLLRVAPSARGVPAALRAAWEQPLLWVPRGIGVLEDFPPDPSGKGSLECWGLRSGSLDQVTGVKMRG